MVGEESWTVMKNADSKFVYSRWAWRLACTNFCEEVLCNCEVEAVADAAACSKEETALDTAASTEALGDLDLLLLLLFRWLDDDVEVDDSPVKEDARAGTCCCCREERYAFGEKLTVEGRVLRIIPQIMINPK